MGSRQTHTRWPDVDVIANLWNVSGSSNQDASLQQYSLCLVTGEATLYVCTDATLGAAAWEPAMAVTGDVNLVEVLGYTALNGGEDGVLSVGGPGADGATAVGYPVRIGGKDGSGNTQDVTTDSDGHLQVDVLSGGGGSAVGDVAHDSADSGNPVKIGGKANAADPADVHENDRVNASYDLAGYARSRSKSYNATAGGDIVVGGVAHDGVDAGYPLKIGGKVTTGTPGTVSNGDRVDAYFDANGRQVVACAGDVPHDTADNYSPVKIGGKAMSQVPTAVGLYDRVNAYFDLNGRLGVFASGPGAAGATAVGYPVRVAGKDGSGNTQDIITDTDGHLQVDILSGGGGAAVGDVAHDAADSGNPVKIGGKASAAVPSDVDEGDRVNASFDLSGKLRAIAFGDVAHDSPDSGYPIKIGGKASSSTPAGPTTGDRVNAWFDMNGRMAVFAFGDVAHDAQDSGYPQKIGGKASTSEPTAVANADRVNAYFDEHGRLAVLPIAYDAGLGADVVSPTITDADRWVPAEELVDTTNLTGPVTYNYPSSDGLEMEEYDHLSICMVCTGGVTVTVEATNDDAASPDWIDITKAAYSMSTDVSGNASYIDKSDILDFDGLNVEKVRIKAICSDSTNGVQFHIRRRKS